MILFKLRIRAFVILGILISITCQASEPQALSISPLGGRQGTRQKITLQGQGLQRAYAIWFDREGVSATVERIEERAAEGENDPSGKSPKIQKLTLGLYIDQSARTGRYHLRVISPQGISGPLPLLVHDLPSIVESQKNTGKTPREQVVTFPCSIEGIISQPGERDLYAVQAVQGQQFQFELISNPSGKSMGGRSGYRGGFDSILTLYQPRGSWFEETRLHRLAYDDKSKANPRPNPLIATRIPRSGLYLLEVGSFYNLGGGEFSYQLRVTSSGPTTPKLPAGNGSRSQPWRERSFSRPIRSDHIRQVLARTVEPSKGVNTVSTGDNTCCEKKESNLDRTAYSIVREQEPNEDNRSVPEATLPFLVEGTIDQPGDVDRVVSFRVQSGQKLSFELETPEATLPNFNPRLAVLDEAGRVVLSNVYRRVVRQNLSYSKTIEPKTMHTFLQGGSYTLQVRDTTQQNGAPNFRYRLLVRSQIPHAGDLEVQEDRLNLVPGEVGKLTITTSQEEGFSGQILLRIEGLPAGVEILPSTHYQPEKPPHLDQGPKARYLSPQGTTSIMVVASSKAPATRMPHILSIRARPVVSGKMGPLLPVGKVHLMVLEQNHLKKEE